MKSLRSMGGEKRSFERGEEDEDEASRAKKPRVPALASVIVEALKVDSLQRLCSSLEPLFRRIVSEEIERALTKLGHAKLAGRSPPQTIEGPEERKLQLHFRTRLPPHLFTGGKVEGEQGAAIHVVLIDGNTGFVVPEGPESAAKVNVVVLEGDFNDEADEEWTKEHFESYEVKEREGKRPLLTGDLQVTLKQGVGTLGDLTFTDNSSWIRSRKFRIGVKVAPGYCDGIRVREAKTEAFAVKDHRGELYKKHYPPALHDEVWRLDRIAKDGALHKKLMTAEILTVEDFLRLLVRDPQRLRSISVDSLVKTAYENWNHVIEYDGKVLLNSLNGSRGAEAAALAGTNNHPLVDNYILGSACAQNHAPSAQHFQNDNIQPSGHQLIEFPYGRSDPTVGLTLTTPQPSFTGNIDYSSVGASSLGGSYLSGDFVHPHEGQGLEDFLSEEIRLRSSQMLENDDMQRLLRTFNTEVDVGVGTAFVHSDEACYSYDAPYEPRREFEQQQSRSSGKAVVGWLKLKAALRWGIFIRKRAAERRAQLVELD